MRNARQAAEPPPAGTRDPGAMRSGGLAVAIRMDAPVLAP